MKLFRAIFGSSSALQEDATRLIAPIDLGTVLENSQNGKGPEPSDQQGVVYYYLGREPVEATVKVPGSTRAQQDARPVVEA